MPLSQHTRKLSGNIRPQSSQVAEPLWTGPDLKGGNCARGLIPTLKEKEIEAQNIFPKVLANKVKATTTTTTIVSCVYTIY